MHMFHTYIAYWNLNYNTCCQYLAIVDMIVTTMLYQCSTFLLGYQSFHQTFLSSDITMRLSFRFFHEFAVLCGLNRNVNLLIVLAQWIPGIAAVSLIIGQPGSGNKSVSGHQPYLQAYTMPLSRWSKCKHAARWKIAFTRTLWSLNFPGQAWKYNSWNVSNINSVTFIRHIHMYIQYCTMGIIF